LDKFTISPPLLAGSAPLISLGLCEARLQNDARWPWIVLIPRRAGAKEIEHLSKADRAQLIEEEVAAGAAVRAMGSALGRAVEKLNIAALGNVTPQLHIHAVGRRADDEAWPGPVWGVGVSRPYEAQALEIAKDAALGVLNGWSAKGP
jgi:diadenosine tetraphosphate (Ap4A) HIT family hydrolase